MAQPRNKFSTTSLKWDVELFPFLEPYPSNNDFGATGSFGSNFISPSATNEGSRIITGIRNMAFNKSKGQPDTRCSFNVQGKPPRECRPGTWVVVSSYQNKINPDGSNFQSNPTTEAITNNFSSNALAEKRKPRFIGQITSMDTDYSADPTSGLIAQTTIFHVREWSQSLNIPVRLDLYAFAQTSADGIPQITSTIAGSEYNPDGVDATVLNQLIQKSFNPFEVAQLILTIIGALQKNDKINSVNIAGLEGFKEVAVKMPSVPQSLLKRLGITDATPRDAFVSGFIKVITGVQTVPLLNDGTWDGIFDTNDNVPSLDDFADSFNKSPSDRPAVGGAGLILQAGIPAWQMLQSWCDPSINEFFTDFVHEITDDGDIGARPVMFIRDKPFSMVSVEKELLPSGSSDKIKSFSKYDNLPRIRIPEENIVKFRLNNTILNSPNFIRINFGDMSSDPDVAKSESNYRPPVRLDAEINRFGGNELDLQSNFMGANYGEASAGASFSATKLPSVNDLSNPSNIISTTGGLVDATEPFEFSKWVEKIKLITQSWHAYDYRMGSGTLSLKDDNFSLTVGFNLSFKIGTNELVGHIEAINTSVAIDGNGTYTTNTEIQLSRIVVSKNGNLNPLQFINPKSFCYLTEDDLQPSIALNFLGDLPNV